MRTLIPQPNRLGRWTAAGLIVLAWLIVVALADTKLGPADGIMVSLAAVAAAASTSLTLAWAERARWRAPITRLTRSVSDLSQNPCARPLSQPELEPELAALQVEIAELFKAVRACLITPRPAGPPTPPSALEPRPMPSEASLTRSGLFDAPPSQDPPRDTKHDPSISGDYSMSDMVNRLEPVGFRWIESSAAEQILLGWTVAELRRKSFLDVLHPDDRFRAEATFAQALSRGEALGLVVRMRTSHGLTRAIEVNVGARYGSNQKVSHLRCHLTDVTDKVRAERALKLRTLELTQVNEQLRRINRELEDLKDRYSDLYENAPAMYFSLSLDGTVTECNRTMLSTLNKSRDQVVGQSYETLLEKSMADRFKARFREFLLTGFVERETRWVKSGGEVIDIWGAGSVVLGSKGSVTHARFVAQDVTVRRRLEAELREKNQRLARTNDELSQRNRELDEFAHAVSHDLQEPLRTLIAFSDFLVKDYGDRLEAEGQEFVRYLVDASRRMRAMIHGMLNLARVGKVIGDFAAVNLEELVGVIKTDLGELFRGKGAELRIVTPLPTIWGDSDRIGQLLANLIANGVKYNRSANPTIEVGAVDARDDGSTGNLINPGPNPAVTIFIRDNGIGIEPQFHAKIFQLFRRLHTHEEFEGTGVGLAICNKIVQAHGGRIWVESGLGAGATFFVRLQTQGSSASPAPSIATTESPARHDVALSQAKVDETNARRVSHFVD